MPLRLTVDARPGKKIPYLAMHNGILVVAVRERALDGRANAAIERAIAAWLGLGVNAVSIVAGASGRRKYVDVEGVEPTVVAQRLAALTER
jgi:uncharacterized protein